MIPKFRIWDKTNKEMLEWEELDLNKERGEDEITIFEPTGQFAHPIFFYDAMQSTGLKDINGTEIYEGDILKTSIKNLVVEWVPKGACWGIGCHYLFHYYETSEVIGNIYENPELLEDE